MIHMDDHNDAPQTTRPVSAEVIQGVNMIAFSLGVIAGCVTIRISGDAIVAFSVGGFVAAVTLIVATLIVRRDGR
ncbi:hypothetical protein GCM10023195_62240 [Actinoallomurus liliacearum]|uniref:Major facilitator superfamily (MFS) profile domain-containing protein n=1 Tax=Actinoallomurus liliacearum TaxID=1080073 RepID=A0ABP8TV08_9ACTN